jgi:hypothetical protein
MTAVECYTLYKWKTIQNIPLTDFWDVTPHTLKGTKLSTLSETLVPINHTMWHHIPEDTDLNTHCLAHFKYHIQTIL